MLFQAPPIYRVNDKGSVILHMCDLFGVHTVAIKALCEALCLLLQTNGYSAVVNATDFTVVAVGNVLCFACTRAVVDTESTRGASMQMK